MSTMYTTNPCQSSSTSLPEARESLGLLDVGRLRLGLVQVVVERVDLGRRELARRDLALEQDVQLQSQRSPINQAWMLTSAKVLPVGSGTRKYA